MKKRHRRILMNVLAFSALAFAIYLSFFHKDKQEDPPRRSASVQTLR